MSVLCNTGCGGGGGGGLVTRSRLSDVLANLELLNYLMKNLETVFVAFNLRHI